MTHSLRSTSSAGTRPGARRLAGVTGSVSRSLSRRLTGLALVWASAAATPLRSSSLARTPQDQVAPPDEVAPRVLVIVQNLSVPLDRRVWLECQALRDQGYEVSVICPMGTGDSSHELLDGVDIYRYPPAPQASGAAGFALEFSYSWLRTAYLAGKIWRQHRFDVIQACNPPDTYWLLALLWRPRGVRFIFDHHDLCPELFLSRFGQPEGRAGRLELMALRWMERMTYLVADRAIVTNGSYQRIAMERDHKDPRWISIVRSGPDTTQMRPVYPARDVRADGEHLLAYIGIMGPQDGVENILALMEELVHRRGRTDVRAVLMGFGDCLEDLRRQSTDLDLDDHVLFTGRVRPDEMAQYLSSADLGLGPDPRTPLNEVSTMNKTMEYMAFGLPSVSFDLVETRASTGDTGVLVPSGDIAAFADAVEELLDDDERRVELGIAARRRAEELLDWRPQAQTYVRVYDQLLGHPTLADRWPYQPHPAAPGSEDHVDLADEGELRRFLREHRPRSRPATGTAPVPPTAPAAAPAAGG